MPWFNIPVHGVDHIAGIAYARDVSPERAVELSAALTARGVWHTVWGEVRPHISERIAEYRPPARAGEWVVAVGDFGAPFARFDLTDDQGHPDGQLLLFDTFAAIADATGRVLYRTAT